MQNASTAAGGQALSSMMRFSLAGCSSFKESRALHPDQESTAKIGTQAMRIKQELSKKPRVCLFIWALKEDPIRFGILTRGFFIGLQRPRRMIKNLRFCTTT